MSTPAWGSDPWYVVDDGYGKLYVRDVGGLIAEHRPPFRYDGQDARYEAEKQRYRARMHLIAAAPDIHDALAALVESMLAQGLCGHLLDDAEYALRKARGEA